MAENNSVGDRYNPPSNLSHDFEQYYFDELEVDELFWQTNNPKDAHQNTPWRKVGLTEARHLKTQKVFNFAPKTKVFQKT